MRVARSFCLVTSILQTNTFNSNKPDIEAILACRPRFSLVGRDPQSLVGRDPHHPSAATHTMDSDTEPAAVAALPPLGGGVVADDDDGYQEYMARIRPGNSGRTSAPPVMEGLSVAVAAAPAAVSKKVFVAVTEHGS